MESSSIDLSKQQEVSSVLDAIMKEHAKIDVERVITEANLSDDNVANLIEYKTTLTKQMVELAKYMSEGAEVHPALNAPKEVKEEFPNTQEMRALTQEARTLLLEHVIDEISGVTDVETAEDSTDQE